MKIFKYRDFIKEGKQLNLFGIGKVYKIKHTWNELFHIDIQVDNNDKVINIDNPYNIDISRWVLMYHSTSLSVMNSICYNLNKHSIKGTYYVEEIE